MIGGDAGKYLQVSTCKHSFAVWGKLEECGSGLSRDKCWSNVSSKQMVLTHRHCNCLND